MSSNKILYKSGYKYQLYTDYIIETGIHPLTEIKTDWIELSVGGILKIKKGYAWDGPSGPTIDTKNFMRGSLVHDALYQHMRMGLLPKYYRHDADHLLYDICRKAGMSRIRAWFVFMAVRLFAGFAVSEKNRHEIIEAP